MKYIYNNTTHVKSDKPPQLISQLFRADVLGVLSWKDLICPDQDIPSK